MAIADVGGHVAAQETRSYQWFGGEEPAWFLRVLGMLQANRGARFELLQAGLFSGDGGRQFVVLRWDYDEDGSDWQGVEFHRVEVEADGTVRLVFLRQLWDDHAAFGEPVAIPGEAPAVVVRYDSDGTWSLLRGIRIIQLARNTVDITPDSYGQTIWFGHQDDTVMADGSEAADRPLWFGVEDTGAPLAEVTDARWPGLYSGAGSAGPFVPVILERSWGRWVPSCRRFRAAYSGDFIDYRYADQYEFDDEVDKATWLAASLLSHMQVGMLGEAHEDLAHLLAFTASSEIDRAMVASINEHLADMLEAAEPHGDASCVLAATDGGDRQDVTKLPMPGSEPPRLGQGSYDNTGS